MARTMSASRYPGVTRRAVGAVQCPRGGRVVRSFAAAPARPRGERESRDVEPRSRRGRRPGAAHQWRALAGAGVRAAVVSSALLLGLGGGLAACGDDDDDASDTVPGQTAEGAASSAAGGRTDAPRGRPRPQRAKLPLVDHGTAVDDSDGCRRRNDGRRGGDRDVSTGRRAPLRRTVQPRPATPTATSAAPRRDPTGRLRRRRSRPAPTAQHQRERAGGNGHRVVGADDLGGPDDDRPGVHVHRQRGVPARPLRRRTADRRPSIGAAGAGVRDRHRRLPLRRPDPLRRARLPGRPGAHRQRRGRRGDVGGPRRDVPARLGHRHQRQRDRSSPARSP